MRSRTGLVALVLVLAAACSEGVGVEPPAVVDVASEHVLYIPYEPGMIVIATLVPFEVREQVTYREVSLETSEGDIELLAARMELTGLRRGATAQCTTAPWPPQGYGPTSPLGAVGTLGRQSLVLYLRAGRIPARTSAIVLTYTDGSGRIRKARKVMEQIVLEAPVEPPPIPARRPPVPGFACADDSPYLS